MRYKPRLLVVDDYPATPTIYRLTLRHQFDIVVAGSLGEAAEILQDYQPDAVILDYYLPDGTGPELLPYIDGEVPVVLLTGNVTAAVEHRDDFTLVFNKPAMVGDVGDAILRVLG